LGTKHTGGNFVRGPLYLCSGPYIRDTYISAKLYDLLVSDSGSLLAHSCKSVVLLADLKDKSALNASFTIGRSVAFIYAVRFAFN
jgi:hypothetical protein